MICGLLLVSPPFAAWMLRGSEAVTVDPAPTPMVQANPAPDQVTRIPVEIVAKGTAPQWVNVEMHAEAIPEPGMLPLVLLPGLLLLRRRRS